MGGGAGVKSVKIRVPGEHLQRVKEKNCTSMVVKIEKEKLSKQERPQARVKVQGR